MKRTSLLCLVSLLALGACASQTKELGPPPVTPSERYSIQVDPAPEELKLGAHASGLSPTQNDALRDFVGRWDAADRKPITIYAPEHGPATAAVYRTADGAREFLVEAGVPPTDVRIVGYDAAGDPGAPIRVGFMSYVASGPQCSHDWEDVAKTHDNREYKLFGCSVTANIAAQIADPEDLVHPRATAPADAARREAVLDKYRLGSTTSTAKDTQANGAVSSTGQ